MNESQIKKKEVFVVIVRSNLRRLHFFYNNKQIIVKSAYFVFKK